MIKEVRNKDYPDRLKELNLWTLEERRNKAESSTKSALFRQINKKLVMVTCLKSLTIKIFQFLNFVLRSHH